MKKKLLLFLFFIQFIFSSAQILPPYIQHFDSAQCTGWNHAALVGSDDWQRGIPNGANLNTSSTPLNVWATNLSGPSTANSVAYLQTPSFNLSSLTQTYVLSFLHQYDASSTNGGQIQSSIDGGLTWQLLNGASNQKLNWYNSSACQALNFQPSWSYNSYPGFWYAAHSLVAFQGQPDVRFRFVYGSAASPQEGWLIDDFSVVEDVPNVVATQGSIYKAAKNFAKFDVVSNLAYGGLFPPTFSNTTNYYFSTDSIFDPGDTFLGSKALNINSPMPAWTQTFVMVPNLVVKKYYIFYKHDANNVLAESNENDNTGFVVLQIDTTFNVPDLHENFEGTTDFWKASTMPLATLFWKKGISNVHQIEGTHSGKKSWYTKDPTFPPTNGIQNQYIESPYIDLSSANNNVMCFWYKAKSSFTSAPSPLNIELSNTNTYANYTNILNVPLTGVLDWTCHCISLSSINGANNAKIRFNHFSPLIYMHFQQSINIDDIFIGQAKPDLSIERKNILITPNTIVQDTMYYTLFNSGTVSSPASVSEFYWSTDSILDPLDILISTVSEPIMNALDHLNKKFAYTKPTTAQGDYFIIYKTDALSNVTEMWENNNIGYYKIKQHGIMPLPYLNNFETQTTGWWHNASIGIDNWQHGMPNATVLNSAFSGSMAFSTTQLSSLSPMSRMHLYSPIFDFTTISDPVLEFDMKLNSEGYCHCFEGKMNLTASTDGGATWKLVDTINHSFSRWHNPMRYNDDGGFDEIFYMANYSELLFKGSEFTFVAYDQYNSRDVDRNTRYINDISNYAGKPHVQFRFNLGSAKNDTTAISTVTLQGATIDNFTIRNKFIDLKVPHKKSLMLSSLTQSITFNMYIKNNGNYISNSAKNKFYLSTDTLLSANDFYLGLDSIPRIQPDMKNYIVESFAAPTNLSNYSYLLYNLDVNNTNIESNEINNISYWPLSLDSIATFPYLQTFNDTVINGWTEYCKTNSGAFLKGQWRFRNLVAPAEYLYQTQIVSGQVFTEMIDFQFPLLIPYWHLQSPSFDFTNSTSLNMSFKLFVYGSNYSGGNMEYSTNGGNTWSILQQSLSAQTYNWFYPNNPLSLLGNATGWSSVFIMPSILDTVNYDLNFLSGQSDVVLRFKFRGNAAPSGNGSLQGMRIDDFKINGITSIVTDIKKQTEGFITMYANNNTIYVNNKLSAEESNGYNLSLINMLGQSIYSKNIELMPNGNIFNLPEGITKGIYIIQISNKKRELQQKIVLMNDN